MVPAENAIVLAVCRESLRDGNEWSVYIIAQGAGGPIDVTVEDVSFEWGNVGQTQAPGTRVTLSPGGVERICRVHTDDAELSMSLTVCVALDGGNWRGMFPLGKLYRYRDPMPIGASGLSGWVRSADDWRPL